MTHILIILIGLITGLFMAFFAKRIFLYIFLILIAFSEFYWIELQGAYIKPFHIVTIFVFLTFGLRYYYVLKSRILYIFLVFFIFESFYLIAIHASLEHWKALALFLILFSISFNSTAILRARLISVRDLVKFFLVATTFIVSFGILQVFLYKVGANFLVLKESQALALSSELRYSAFFTEPDNCAKFLAVSLLIIFPYVVTKKKFRNLYILLVGGFLLDMTRSAILAYIGALVIGIIIFNFAPYKNNIKLVQLKFIYYFVILILLSFLLLKIGVSFFGAEPVFKYRFGSMIRLHETLETDPSLPVRKAGITRAFEASVSNLQSLILGQGWGASYWLEQGSYKANVKGSANLYIMFLFFSGLIGLSTFLLIITIAIKNLLFAVKMNIYPEFSAGIFLAIIASLIMGILSSNIIAPEFWVMIGCAAFVELEVKRRFKVNKVGILERVYA